MIRILDEPYNQSLQTQFRDLIFTSFRYHRNRSIILLGISSSGKSSIANSIEAIIGSGGKSIEIDEIIRATTIKILTAKLGERFSKMHAKYGSNTLHFIFDERSHHSFKQVKDDLLELNALQTSALKHIEQIKATSHAIALETAKNIACNFGIAICQAVSIKNLYRFHEFNPYLVVIECSIVKVLQNVAQRNNQAEMSNDMGNVRSPEEVSRQFQQLYSARNSNKLQRLQDLAVNTDNNSPEECAKQILSGFSSRPKYVLK